MQARAHKSELRSEPLLRNHLGMAWGSASSSSSGDTYSSVPTNEPDRAAAPLEGKGRFVTPRGTGLEDGPSPKVCQLRVHLRVQQHVVRLQVPSEIRRSAATCEAPPSSACAPARSRSRRSRTSSQPPRTFRPSSAAAGDPRWGTAR